MIKYTYSLGILLLAAVSFAQMQVNPQVNTGIYAGSGPTAIRYAGQYQQSGQNTVFNISSNTADTRGGYANTGMYAPVTMLYGNSPAYQNLRDIPPSMVSGSPARAPYTAPSPGQVNSQMGGQVNSQINGQINAQVSGQINGAAY